MSLALLSLYHAPCHMARRPLPQNVIPRVLACLSPISIIAVFENNDITKKVFSFVLQAMTSLGLLRSANWPLQAMTSSGLPPTSKH